MTATEQSRSLTHTSNLGGTRSADASQPPALATRLDETTALERQRAACALLQHPLITADGPLPIEFGLVRRHATWLREWFAQHAGWGFTLHSEVARLRKTPVYGGIGTRPARDPKGETEFTRRRYVLLCLLLAVLEQEDRQTTLGQLAEKLAAMCVSDTTLVKAGMAFDISGMDHRRDLVQAVRLLLCLGVLRRRHGNEEQFVSDKGDALYNIVRPVLGAVLCVKRGPSTVDETVFDSRIAAIIEEPIPETNEGRARRIRSQLMRRLLDDPVVYYEELEQAEFDYLNSQRPRLLKHVEQATGMVPEVRREGIAMLDVRGDTTDLRLPKEGTDGHLTLLVSQFLAEELRKGNSIVGYVALGQHVANLIETHKRHWRRDVTFPGAVELLVKQVVERLESLALICRTSDGVRPLPAVARYSLSRDEEDLFDQ